VSILQIELKQINNIFIEIIKDIENSLDLIESMKFQRKMKLDGSPVTLADYYIQDKIVFHLKNNIKDINIISEEKVNSSNDLIEDFYYAVVDPIDGTENFTSGIPIWGVAISVWKYPQHLSSLLYLPILKKYLMSGMSIDKVDSRIKGFSSNPNKLMIGKMTNEDEIRIFGCSVFNFYNVISGSFSSYMNLTGAYVWDLVSGLILAYENGLEVICDGKVYNGEFPNPNKRHTFEVNKK